MSISIGRAGPDIRARMQSALANSPKIDPTNSDQLAASHLKGVTLSQQTPKSQAMAAAEKAASVVMEAQLSAARIQAQTNKDNTGMPLADVATLTPQEARYSLAALEKLMEHGDQWAIRGANQGKKTSSIETYAEWLRDRAGPAAQTPTTQLAGSLINISA
ncbi:MAG: hypothetical protein K6T59_17885 [Bryobacteraceae bacterium]|nr:hypothetical protein [Bryobacteraceae bacterium]